MKNQANVVVVGAGHNGLVAALMLARKKLDVLVLEDKEVLGGAVRTEKPFKKAPGLATSTGAYLLGLMPPELIRKLGVDLPLLRRDPHYFLPTTGKRYLLLGSDQAAMKQQFTEFFSEQDFRANQALQEELSAIRDDVHETWLEEPLSIEETASRYLRPQLRTAFVDLCRKPVGHLSGEVRLQVGSPEGDVRRHRRLLRPQRRLGHARHRDELPHPQHVPPARLRRHLDDRQGRDGHGHAALRAGGARGGRAHRDRALGPGHLERAGRGVGSAAQGRHRDQGEALVADVFALPPPKVEKHFGITRGHIHHVDNAFGFADRLPYSTPVQGLYSCSAGCHPAGSVIGAAGHNAAERVLRDLAR